MSIVEEGGLFTPLSVKEALEASFREKIFGGDWPKTREEAIANLESVSWFAANDDGSPQLANTDGSPATFRVDGDMDKKAAIALIYFFLELEKMAVVTDENDNLQPIPPVQTECESAVKILAKYPIRFLQSFPLDKGSIEPTKLDIPAGAYTLEELEAMVFLLKKKI